MYCMNQAFKDTMKLTCLFAMSFLAVLWLGSCVSSPKTPTALATSSHNSQNSLDWDGVYHGVLPCADCEGIATMISLNKDNRFQIWRKYKGKQDSTIYSKGTFTWNKEGSAITLNEGSTSTTFWVG